jgi:hypothetical protein
MKKTITHLKITTMKKKMFISVLLFSLASGILVAQKKVPTGYMRVEECKKLRFFRSDSDIRSYINSIEQLQGLNALPEPLGNCDTVKKYKNELKSGLNSIPIDHAYYGTIVEAWGYSNDSLYCTVNVTSKLNGAETLGVVTKNTTYYVLDEDMHYFDNQEDWVLGLLTMPFIYKFSDQSFGAFNTVAAHLKYKFRLSNDKYISLGAVVGGSVFNKSIANPDSIAKHPEIDLLIGGGVAFEATEKINVGIMGGGMFGQNPSGWLSVILGIDLFTIAQ